MALPAERPLSIRSPSPPSLFSKIEKERSPSSLSIQVQFSQDAPPQVVVCHEKDGTKHVIGHLFDPSSEGTLEDRDLRKLWPLDECPGCQELLADNEGLFPSTQELAAEQETTLSYLLVDNNVLDNLADGEYLNPTYWISAVQIAAETDDSDLLSHLFNAQLCESLPGDPELVAQGHALAIYSAASEGYTALVKTLLVQEPIPRALSSCLDGAIRKAITHEDRDLLATLLTLQDPISEGTFQRALELTRNNRGLTQVVLGAMMLYYARKELALPENVQRAIQSAVEEGDPSSKRVRTNQ